MTHRILAGLAVATVVVVGGLVSTAANSASQVQASAPAAPPETRTMQADESGMVALQRHAQVDMLLYFGDLSPNRAPVALPVNAVVLALPAAAK